MKTLLQAVQIIDPSSEFHLQRKNILFENGKISQITDNLCADLPDQSRFQEIRKPYWSY